MRTGAYGRYSTDEQKQTSLDDQLRCCAETASRHGLALSPHLVFSDDAVTGAAKGTHKRAGYLALRAAVRAGEIDVIVVDQSCRLARHAAEALAFFDELRQHNVRLLTADGFDSEHQTAQLLFGIKSLFAEFFLDETRHRVRRGMQGEFDRGSMVTAVPFGYRVDAERSAKAGICVWAVCDKEAAVIRDLYQWRKGGMSFNQMAAALNGRRVEAPGEGSRGKGLYWRASALWRILRNPIYRGLYQVKFGTGKEASRAMRLQPELALVSAEDWSACQSNGEATATAGTQMPSGEKRKAIYGGGRHPLSGVFRCGVCGNILTVHCSQHDSGSLHCVGCEHATAAGVPGRRPHYVSLKGMKVMLRWLLARIVTGEALVRYRELLRSRLEGGRAQELDAAMADLSRAEAAQDRLLRLMRKIGQDDATLEENYLAAREESLLLGRRVEDLERGLRTLDRKAIERQMSADVSPAIDALLDDDVTPGKTRAVLNRVFPRLALLGKTDCWTALFEVHVKMGALLAEATQTADLGDGAGDTVMYLRLRTSGPKQATWAVEEVDATTLAAEPAA